MCIEFQDFFFSYGLLEGKKNWKLGQPKPENTSSMSCHCLSAVVGSIPGPVCLLLASVGSHILQFLLSVQPLLVSIHLPAAEALSLNHIQ